MVDFLSSNWRGFCYGGHRFDGHKGIDWYIQSPDAVNFEEPGLD